MKKLIANRPILYGGRQYERGETLPAYDSLMVDAWLRADSAKYVEDAAENTVSGTAGVDDNSGNNNQEDANAQRGDGNDGHGDADGSEENAEAEGRLDPAQLEKMSKEDLVKLAADMDVELPRGATKALIIEKLAAVPVYIHDDGDTQ